MNLIHKFIEQREAFETAYENGDWSLLDPFLHEDITYEVMNMPFHCVIKGRAQVLAGFKRSVEGFDKLCIRTVGIGTKAREEGANVLGHGGIRFERPNCPPLNSTLLEIATYRGDKIERLVDVYDPGMCAEFETWMAKWGAGLDASYV
jgi:hypothetical protein